MAAVSPGTGSGSACGIVRKLEEHDNPKFFDEKFTPVADYQDLVLHDPVNVAMVLVNRLTLEHKALRAPADPAVPHELHRDGDGNGYMSIDGEIQMAKDILDWQAGIVDGVTYAMR